MKPLLPVFLFLSALGFFLSLVAHLGALAGVSFPGYVWALHVGAILLCFPAQLAGPTFGRHSRQDYWRVVLRRCPKWMQRLAWTVFGYGIFNFFLFLIQVMLHLGRVPGQGNGQIASPLAVWGFSGHWMVFYCGQAAIFYAAAYGGLASGSIRCPYGHSVREEARFCDQCGAAIGKEPEEEPLAG
jgi:hypothetical protein